MHAPHATESSRLAAMTPQLLSSAIARVMSLDARAEVDTTLPAGDIFNRPDANVLVFVDGVRPTGTALASLRAEERIGAGSWGWGVGENREQWDGQRCLCCGVLLFAQRAGPCCLASIRAPSFGSCHALADLFPRTPRCCITSGNYITRVSQFSRRAECKPASACSLDGRCSRSTLPKTRALVVPCWCWCCAQRLDVPRFPPPHQYGVRQDSSHVAALQVDCCALKE